ncbi:MAG TPA: amidohydrolase family protein [Humisphaera sp.]|nr:amidohydrolase family protein [Humisphaera sp.]
MSLTRREVLIATAGAPILAALASADGATPDGERRMPVVDTHVHCFAGAADREFPYHPRGPYAPQAASPPELLLERMDQAQVDHAIIVHPEPYQDDHRYLEHCLKVGAGRLKATCLFFAGRKDSVARLRDLVARNGKGIVALRIHAYAPERQPPFGKPELRALWQAAADLGLAIQLHFEPRYGLAFEPLIAEFSKTPVIIDHLGRPEFATPAEHAAVLRWSRFENTTMKLSALPRREQYPHRDIAPFVRDAVSAFTPSRLMYGGGFDDKATAASYRATRERVRSFVADLTPAEQAKILGGNAARLFGFGGARR